MMYFLCHYAHFGSAFIQLGTHVQKYLPQENKMQFSQVDFSSIAFSALQANKGVKTANATLRGGPCEFFASSLWVVHSSGWCLHF